MDQTIAQVPSPLPSDTQELSFAVAILSQHKFLRPLLSATLADGYQFSINPDLKAMAIHEPKSPSNDNPTIEFLPGRTSAQYAESLCHELVHFAIMRAGRIYGLNLNPLADMAMRLCEEAAVLAITSDLMFQAGLGINMRDDIPHPELWEANMNSSFYTAQSYKVYSDNTTLAVQKSFERFYAMPDQKCRRGYQIHSMNSILAEKDDVLLNPKNFTENFSPREFNKFLPAPYNEILKPCLMQMNPMDKEHLVLGFFTATEVEILFNRRQTSFGMRPSNWKIFVENGNGGVFQWHLGGDSLVAQRTQSLKPILSPRSFMVGATPTFAQ